MDQSLLSVKELQTFFSTEQGNIITVDQVSFGIKPGETLAVVGESGSGKSVTALSIMGLLGKNGQIAKGEILFEGKDLTKLSTSEMQKLRGKEISMIFQEPMTALNPLFTIGFQLEEIILLHLKLSKKEATKLAVTMLEKVGIQDATRVMNEYPFALSGGMRQRVMIAMALVCKPKLLIADEPTTALDVTVQAQIMELLKELCKETNTAIMLITHDLGVVAQMADQVAVMYAGQVVEYTDVYSLFDHPSHPYTKGLLESIPTIHSTEELVPIKGAVPSRYQDIKGCRFANRCFMATEICHKDMPKLEDVNVEHYSRCFYGEQLNKL